MDRTLLSILACPICKGELLYKKTPPRLICKIDRLAFPIRQGIPVVIEEEAEQLTLEQIEKL